MDHQTLPNSTKPKLIHFVFASFSILVWGLSFSVTRSVVQQVPPLTLACMRFFIAAGFLWGMTAKYKQRLQGKDRKWIWTMALTGITFYFIFENVGLKLTTASHAALIIATIPLGTELVVARLKRRWPSITTTCGTFIALVGVGLLVGRDDGMSSLIGDGLMFGAVGCWIAYTFIVSHLSGRYPNLLITRWIMLCGAVSFIPGVAVELYFLNIPRLDTAAWAQVAFLSLACSALAYDTWNRAVPALGPTAVNTLIYFIPLVGVVSGIIFLGEPLTETLLYGGALIMGGVVLARI